jgi:hypothetical protein
MMKRAKTGGRQRGTPNKLTADIKAAIEGALDAVGGQQYLERVAQEQPQVFCALLGRLLPKTQNQTVSMQVDQKKPIDMYEGAKRIAFILEAGLQDPRAALTGKDLRPRDATSCSTW